MSAEWGKITAQEILGPTGGILISGNGRISFSGLSTDSRTVGPNELFWALKGDRFDGHDFVQKALEQGARGIVIQKDHVRPLPCSKTQVVIAVRDTLRAMGDLAAWWRHQHAVRVTAVTGSAGKTTTKEMTAEILALGHKTLVSPGNFNNLIGLPVSLLRLKGEHKSAVLEMGMNHPGEIARLTEIADPDVGVITNVGMAHLEGLGDIQGVARAKTELIEKISPTAKVVLNGDDALLMETAAPFQKDVITFGLRPHNDIRCTNLKNPGPVGSSFCIQNRVSAFPVRINIPGLQNVWNALAAAAVCLCLDVSREHIKEGLRRFKGVAGRFTPISLPRGVTLVDDTYNANPTSLKAALESVKSMVQKGGRIMVGLGEMMELGDETIAAHRNAGRWVAELDAHRFAAVGEHARLMVDSAVAFGMNRNEVRAVDSVHEMAEFMGQDMKKGDLIFLKGSRKMDMGKVVDNLRGRRHGSRFNHET